VKPLATTTSSRSRVQHTLPLRTSRKLSTRVSRDSGDTQALQSTFETLRSRRSLASPIPRPTSLTPSPFTPRRFPCGPRVARSRDSPAPGTQSRDSPRLPLDALPRLPWPRSANLPWAPLLRHPAAILSGLLTHPAWSPRIAEPLPTPRGAVALPQRPGTLLPTQADA
jgi:hypothetical protein